MLELAHVIDVGWYVLLPLIIVFVEYSFDETVKTIKKDKENKENTTLH